MSSDFDVIFLGVSNPGIRIYNWLCDQDDVFVHSILTSKEQLSMIEDIQPDYVVSCGYEHVIPEKFLEIPSEGCLNLHPAYLPYNRGVHSNVWSIVDNTPAGVTLHYMDSHIDTGDIIARHTVETDFSDTGKTLDKRLGDKMVKIFQETWPDIVMGKTSTREQDRDNGTYHSTNDLQELCELDPDAKVQVKRFLDRLRGLAYPPHRKAVIEVDDETYYVEISIEKR